MIKKLLLAGALALTFLSEGFAQTTIATDSGFYSKNDASAIQLWGTNTYGTATTSGGNVQIPVTAPSGTAYNSFVYQFASVTIPKHADSLRFSIAATPDANTGAPTIRVVLGDGNGYLTDNITALSFTANSTLTEYAVALPAAALQDYYSNPNTIVNGCTPNTVANPTCPVDSTDIIMIQFLPNPDAKTAYTGTITVGYVYLGDTTTVKKAVVWPNLGPAVTVVGDSGFYSRGDISPQLFGTSVGTGTPYTVATDPTNNNVILSASINSTVASTYPAVTFNIYNPNTQLSDTIAIPKHADSLWLYASADANVPVRIGVQDANGYTADQITEQTIKTTPTLIKIGLPASVWGDYYSPVKGGACTVPNGATNPCPVDSQHVVLLLLTPNPGAAYTGNISIGYIYVGDTATVVQQITGVTAAAATAATSIFPNPTTSGVANYNVAVSGVVTATLADMTGKVVGVQNGASGSFDVSGLNKGVYVVSFALNGAYYSSQKLVVSGN